MNNFKKIYEKTHSRFTRKKKIIQYMEIDYCKKEKISIFYTKNFIEELIINSKLKKEKVLKEIENMFVNVKAISETTDKHKKMAMEIGGTA